MTLRDTDIERLMERLYGEAKATPGAAAGEAAASDPEFQAAVRRFAQIHDAASALGQAEPPPRADRAILDAAELAAAAPAHAVASAPAGGAQAAQARKPIPRYARWQGPAAGLAAASVLIVTALILRETPPSELESIKGLDQKPERRDEPAAAAQTTTAPPAPAAAQPSRAPVAAADERESEGLLGATQAGDLPAKKAAPAKPADAPEKDKAAGGTTGLESGPGADVPPGAQVKARDAEPAAPAQEAAPVPESADKPGDLSAEEQAEYDARVERARRMKETLLSLKSKANKPSEVSEGQGAPPQGPGAGGEAPGYGGGGGAGALGSGNEPKLAKPDVSKRDKAADSFLEDDEDAPPPKLSAAEMKKYEAQAQKIKQEMAEAEKQSAGGQKPASPPAPAAAPPANEPAESESATLPVRFPLGADAAGTENIAHGGVSGMDADTQFLGKQWAAAQASYETLLPVIEDAGARQRVLVRIAVAAARQGNCAKAQSASQMLGTGKERAVFEGKLAAAECLMTTGGEPGAILPLLIAVEKYGPWDLQRHALMARRRLEGGQ